MVNGDECDVVRVVLIGGDVFYVMLCCVACYEIGASFLPPGFYGLLCTSCSIWGEAHVKYTKLEVFYQFLELFYRFFPSNEMAIFSFEFTFMPTSIQDFGELSYEVHVLSIATRNAVEAFHQHPFI